MAGEPDDVDAMVEPVVPGRHRWLAGGTTVDLEMANHPVQQVPS